MTKTLIPLGLVVGLALLFLACLAPTTTEVTNPTDPGYWTRERLKDLPLSQHALNDHLDRATGASFIQQWMSRKECKPLLLYICTAAQEVMITCPNPLESTADLIGLFIGWAGNTSPKVITGYPARSNYWADRFQKIGCVGPYPIP